MFIFIVFSDVTLSFLLCYYGSRILRMSGSSFKKLVGTPLFERAFIEYEWAGRPVCYRCSFCEWLNRW